MVIPFPRIHSPKIELGCTLSSMQCLLPLVKTTNHIGI